jgi:8-hydroxy-5-deazaflavin:NADPH oxidoreductase
MKIGIIGTGMVGKALAAKLVEIGHDVMIGTRNVSQTLTRTEKDAGSNPPFSEWQKQHPKVRLGTFEQAAQHGEVIISATSGAAALAPLKLADAANLKGKILMDISNPLDFSMGMPPTLSVCNTDSLGEQIQRSFPDVKVVKTLNTTNASMMVNPRQLVGGDHTMFVSGNDAAAKSMVISYLKDWFGWKDVIDLGDISTARGTEMLLPIWIRLYGILKTPAFNFKIVR